MNLAATAPIWLFGLLALTLIAAAVQDMRQLRISNILVLAVATLAIVAMGVVGPSWALWQNGALMVALLAVGTAAFAAGLFGGGDVKMIAALGLWVSLTGAVRLLATIFIAGGILALIFIIVRQLLRKPGSGKVKGQLPYGVAIAAGALLAFQMQRWEAEPKVPPIPVVPLPQSAAAPQ